MLSIGIIDDGIGFVPTLIKLRQSVSAEFLCVVCGEDFPLGEQNAQRLVSVGNKAVQLCEQRGCKAAVISSVAMSRVCRQLLHPVSDVYGCDAPLMHGLTYTASNVLAVGDAFALRNQSFDGIITVAMPQFPLLAEAGNERKIVEYISELCEPHTGQFDCIAFANSSMNLYKHCFARVFPNVKLFDSLEGVARRIRKNYKKHPQEEGKVTVVNLDGTVAAEKYTIFGD